MMMSSRARATIRVGLAFAAMMALGACASISQRAMANGRTMGQGRAYQSFMSGNRSFESQRALRDSFDPRSYHYNEVAYPAFGSWWY